MAENREHGFTVLRNRDFRAFLGARALTGSAFALGMVGLAQFLPALLLALPGGLAADRFERRSILLASPGAPGPGGLDLPRGGPGRGGAGLLGPGKPVPCSVPGPEGGLPPGRCMELEHSPGGNHRGPCPGRSPVCFRPGLCLCSYHGTLCPRRSADGAHARAAARSCQRETGTRGHADRPPLRLLQPIILGAISLDLFAVLFGGATALLPIYGRDILRVGPWGLGLLRSAPAAGAAAVAFGLAHRPLARRAGAGRPGKAPASWRHVGTGIDSQ
jgi:hypothetical protein